MYIKRALEPIILKYSEAFKVVVVTGPRQVGKTTMLKHLMDEEDIGRKYVSLDGSAERMLAKEDPELFLQRWQAPVLIDEVQNAPELLPYIKMAVDDINEPGGFWLTGSQPFHLMKGVSESLAGRAGVVEMLGLSGAELSARETAAFNPSPDYFLSRVKGATPLTSGEVFDRICAGGFPGIALAAPEIRSAAYESLVDTYLMRDIRDLSQVADELKFRRFLVATASLTGRPLVYSEIARLADIDQRTAKEWMSVLVSSYLVKLVAPISSNALKRLVKQPTIHFTDTGLAAHLAGWSSPETLELGAISGQIFETYAFGEIWKSYSNLGLRPEVSFFRNRDQREIDLIVSHDNVIHPVEIRKSASPKSSDVKTFSALSPLAESGASRVEEVGMGALVCLAHDTVPLNNSAWSMPIWAI